MTNRVEPTGADFDDMHHALGRPTDPLGTCLRNHYCIGAGTETAQRFEALGWWTKGHTLAGGLTVYRVNDAGRAALAAYLEKMQE